MNATPAFGHEPTPMPRSNTDINLASYNQMDNMVQYAERSLQTPEARLLLEILSTSKTLRVLDIGCGGGRFYFFLRGLIDHYVGIDYSSAAVEICRRLYPQGDFRFGDMRDLSAHRGAGYDLVIVAFNSIDTLHHDDRKLALREIRQLLRSGGLLVFSSHNRSHLHALRFRFPRPPLTLNPCRLLPALLPTSRHWLRYLRLKRFEQRHPEYEIVVDEGHGYGLLTYYLDRTVQQRQLQEHGFVLQKSLDRSGNELQGGDPAADSAWIYYLAEAA